MCIFMWVTKGIQFGIRTSLKRLLMLIKNTKVEDQMQKQNKKYILNILGCHSFIYPLCVSNHVWNLQDLVMGWIQKLRPKKSIKGFNIFSLFVAWELFSLLKKIPQFHLYFSWVKLQNANVSLIWCQARREFNDKCSVFWPNSKATATELA